MVGAILQHSGMFDLAHTTLDALSVLFMGTIPGAFSLVAFSFATIPPFLHSQRLDVLVTCTTVAWRKDSYRPRGELARSRARRKEQWRRG